MIKSGLKNYFKSYRYFFVPLGALALGVVAAISVMLPLIGAAIREFVRGAGEIAKSHSLDWNAVKDTLIAAFRDLDWAHPQQMMNEVFTKEYLSGLLQSCATAAIGDTAVWREEINALVSSSISKLTGALIAGAVFVALGIFVAFFVTKRLIRHDVAKRKGWKVLLVAFVDALLNITVVAFGVWLVVKVKAFVLISLCLVVLLYGAISFFEAYLVHGYKKVPFKEIFRIKNFFKLFLLALIEIAIMAAIVAIVFALTNAMIGIFVGFGVFLITQSCISLNAEAYVKGQADARKDASTPVLPEGVLAPEAAAAGEAALTVNDVAQAEEEGNPPDPE